MNGKLLFALCKTCAETKQQETCNHTDEERSFIGTWVSDELKKALEKGYEIIEMYEVWHFEKTSQYDPDTKTGGLFTEYVNTFLKMKQEASGWPEWCDNDDNKHKYINDYYEREGIQLDYDNIRKNPGLRSLAKLMLNSFWGKFGQRTNMQRLSHIADPAEFFDMLTNDEQTITGINFINDDIVELRWKYCDEFVESTGRTNVVIAAYTTALARLKLYSYLEVLGSRALYADTDSVIFKSGSPDLELGDYLGDLTNEVPEGDLPFL